MAFQEAITIGVVLTAKDLYTSAIHKAEREIRRLGRVSEKQARSFESSLRRYRRMAEVGIVAMMVGQRMSAAFRHAREEAAQFHQEMQNIMSILATRGLPTDQVQRYREEIERTAMSIAERYGISASQVLRESYNLVSGIEDVRDAIAAMEPAAALATAGLGDYGQAVRLLTGLANTYGKAWGDTLTPSEKMIRIANMMARAVNLNYTVIPELSEALENVHGDALMSGQSLSTLVALLGELANRGIKGSEAGNALRRAFVNLLDVQKRLGIRVTDSEGKFRDFLDVLQDLRERVERGGLSPQLLDKITKAFDIFGARAVKALLPTLDRLIELRNELEQSSTQLDRNSFVIRMADQVLRGYEKQIATIEERWRNLRIEMGSRVLPIHLQMKRLVLDLVGALEGLPGAEKILPWAFAIADLAGSTMTLLGTLVSLVSTIKLWQLTSALTKANLAAETAEITSQNAALTKNITLWGTRTGAATGMGAGWITRFLPLSLAFAAPVAMAAATYEHRKEQERQARALLRKAKAVGRLTPGERTRLATALGELQAPGIIHEAAPYLTETERRYIQTQRELKIASQRVPTESFTGMRAYQTGGYVAKTGPALLHEGEYVLPKWDLRVLLRRRETTEPARRERPVRIEVKAPIHIHSGAAIPPGQIEREVLRAIEKAWRTQWRRLGFA